MAALVDFQGNVIRGDDRIRELEGALRMVLENMGGHQHWDSFGTNGANCPICKRQLEAMLQASEVLNRTK